MVKNLIEKLDRPSGNAAPGGNIYVVYLKNAEATRLATTLRAQQKADSNETLRIGLIGCGGGFHVWVNGKPIAEMVNCIGRGGSGRAYGAYITREWFDDFAKGEVTIAVKSFLRFNDKYNMNPTKPEPQGFISVDIFSVSPIDEKNEGTRMVRRVGDAPQQHSLVLRSAEPGGRHLRRGVATHEDLAGVGGGWLGGVLVLGAAAAIA